jgi:hypothetical protein
MVGDGPICLRAKCEVTTPALVLSPTCPPETVGVSKRGVNQKDIPIIRQMLQE